MPICSATYSCLRCCASSRLSVKSPSYFAPLKSASSPRLSRKIRSISEYVNSSSRWSATRLRERHEPAAALVPELQARGATAVPEGDYGHVVEHRHLVVRALQVVIGDPGVQVVDVMEPDVAGEELEHLREL